jgi:hypothetical protein
MNERLYRLLFIAVGIFAALTSTAQAQFTIDAYIEAPSGGPLTATCTIEQSENAGLGLFFDQQTDNDPTLGYPGTSYDYYGQVVNTCVLSGPNNYQDSCGFSTNASASTNVDDSTEAECTITVNNPASGEYQVVGEFYTNNWYENDDVGYLCDPGVFWDPLDFEDADVYTWDGQKTLSGAGGFNCTDNQDLLLGDSEEILTYTAPISVTVSPTSATLPQGDNEEFSATVTGGNDSGISWLLSGPGSFSPSGTLSSTSGQTVTYYAPDSYSAGSATIRATSTQDTTKSATADITLQVSNPEITSVPTASLPVGQSSIITFSGRYLGTSQPNITDNEAGVMISSIGTPTPAESNGQVQSVSFVVTVPNCIPANSVTFQISVTDGAPNPNASITMGIQNQTPAPQIMISPTNLALCQGGSQTYNGANETDVFAGQQVQLCVAAAPAGCSITSQSWEFENIVDISGGFQDTLDDGGPPSAAAGGEEASDPLLSQTGTNLAPLPLTFYFVNPRTTETATYNWVLSNGNANGASSTADFFIDGPTGVSVTAPESLMNIQQVQTTVANGSQTETTYVMGLPSINVPGILFTATGGGTTNTPGASAGFMWVQVLTDKNQSVGSTGRVQCLSAGYPDSALDNFYPYPPYMYPYRTEDSPQSHGIDGEGEDARVFKATMYLMWNAALPSGCTLPSTTALGNNAYQTSPGQGCTSIPVPLGSAVWSACADAIDTLNPAVSASQWTLACANPQTSNSGPAFTTDSGFPAWQTTSLTNITVNGKPQVSNESCTPEP